MNSLLVWTIRNWIILSVLSVLFNANKVFANKTSTSEESVYQINSPWKNQKNEDIMLSTFSGQHVILGMIYTGCAHTCPLTISKIQDIEKHLKTQGKKNYKLILASFDTKNDTPKHLKNYMKTHGLDESHWVFLSTDKDSNVRQLATALGITYKELGNGNYSHSNIISYLNEKGFIQAKLKSLSSDIEPLLEKINSSF